MYYLHGAIVTRLDRRVVEWDLFIYLPTQTNESQMRDSDSPHPQSRKRAYLPVNSVDGYPTSRYECTRSVAEAEKIVDRG